MSTIVALHEETELTYRFNGSPHIWIEEMTPERLDQLLAQFPNRRVAVLGDFFLDKYLEVAPSLAEPSLETGRVAHQVTGVRRSPGAAGTVVNNLAALKAGELHAIGAIGDDGEGFDLCQGLQRIGCSTNGLIRSSDLLTPTYLKPCDVDVPGLAGEHSRYDTKNRRPTPKTIVDQVASELDRILPNVDALLVMDQVEMPNCGVVTSDLRDYLASLALRFPRVLFWVDSRRHIRLFRNVVIKANQFEAVDRLNPAVGEEVSLEELRKLVPKLRSEMGAPVFVTCGHRGILVSDPDVALVPTRAATGPLDPTGAGDSVSAGAVLSLSSGATPTEAALIGNLVASVTIRQLGTTGTSSPEQLRLALNQWKSEHPSTKP